MKHLFLVILWVSYSCAIDYTDMFYTNEPFNSYNLEDYDTFVKRKLALEQPTEENSDSNSSKIGLYDPLEGGVTSFKGHLGLVGQLGFDGFGNDILLSVEHTLPHALQGYQKFFVQADISLMLNALTDSLNASHRASYAYLALSGGYAFDVFDDKTQVKPRAGVAIFAPTYNFVFEGGVSIERQIEENIKLVADVTFMSGVAFLNLGASYVYQAE